MFITYIVHFTFCLMTVSCMNNYENTDKDTSNEQLLDKIARYLFLDRSDLQAPEEQQTSSALLIDVKMIDETEEQLQSTSEVIEQQTSSTQPIDVIMIDESEEQLQSTSEVITRKSVHTKEQSFEMLPLVHDDCKKYDECEQQHLVVPDKLADVDAKSTKSEQKRS